MHIPCQLGCRSVLHSFKYQMPHSSCRGEAENHIPRSSTQTNKNPNLSSETDPGLRSATPMLTQRQQHTCTRRAALKFSISGREAIRQYLIVRGGNNKNTSCHRSWLSPPQRERRPRVPLRSAVVRGQLRQREAQRRDGGGHAEGAEAGEADVQASVGQDQREVVQAADQVREERVGEHVRGRPLRPMTNIIIIIIIIIIVISIIIIIIVTITITTTITISIISIIKLVLLYARLD